MFCSVLSRVSAPPAGGDYWPPGAPGRSPKGAAAPLSRPRPIRADPACVLHLIAALLSPPLPSATSIRPGSPSRAAALGAAAL